MARGKESPTTRKIVRIFYLRQIVTEDAATLHVSYAAHRKVPPQAVDKVAASIREFGWRQPIVVDRHGVIICGHTRLLAAHKLGLEEAPVHVAGNLTPAQVRTYRLLDNRSHEETTWDPDLLGFELMDLRGLGVDLDLTGFDHDELEDFLSRADPAFMQKQGPAFADIPLEIQIAVRAHGQTVRPACERCPSNWGLSTPAWMNSKLQEKFR